MDDDKRETELQMHQDGRVYPLGRVLRSTYDAENHDSLGSDVTGLMIDLSKIPYDPSETAPAPLAAGPPLVARVPLVAEAPPPARGWATRLGGWFGRGARN